MKEICVINKISIHSGYDSQSIHGQQFWKTWRLVPNSRAGWQKIHWKKTLKLKSDKYSCLRLGIVFETDELELFEGILDFASRRISE